MTHGIISAAQPEAAEAGADILASGGNAVDAAVAAALVQTAVDPQMCGIAGFGCMHIYMPSRNAHVCLDFHGRAPLAARPDMWADRVIGEAEDGYGFILEGRVNEVGYGAITSPMTLRALDHALQAYGTMQLQSLLAPAIAYCEEGFMVRPHVVTYWSQTANHGRIAHEQFLRQHPATAAIYIKPDGRLHRVGETLRNPDMGRTYRRIAEHGVEEFYSGAIAREIVADMSENGGMLRADDLAQVAVETNPPLRGTYRGLEITTNQPPGGGLLIVQMLNILENFDLQAMGHNSPDYIATVAEAMKIATVDKDRYIGDPRFVEVPVARLASKAYAAECAERIRRGEKQHVPRFNPGAPESKNTTHVNVADEHGTCVTVTHTLGQPSGIVTKGLGFMYNGAMAQFDPRPGRATSIAPGKSRFSALCPTIVFKEGKPVFVVGAPGNTYITMGVVQAILNAVDFGMNAQEAVSAPRFCATSDVIEISNRITRRAERELAARGYPMRRYPFGYHFSGVHALRLVGDAYDGGADPGRDGMAMSV
ncbi:MAG: gamma-glutamyltransferase [Hyphomicrobiaceae bacterium]